MVALGKSVIMIKNVFLKTIWRLQREGSENTKRKKQFVCTTRNYTLSFFLCKNLHCYLLL